ncbi:Serine/threonine-protein kinase tel1 [Colletotrichum fioriniae]|uniref:Serine/threonine-protein kinase tel1 n=1 Tax=Colletotrichum fioriniae TaxID=710243 RepID=UPI0032DBC134|nr:Serine/threonine-protein kinase tel1 [Colletotrichum fioriniae]
MSQVKSADNSDSWRQLWQLASRAVGLPSASRTASVLLHTVLERNLVLYHDVSDDINSIVTTADVNGPALLVDSSITLMSHLRSLRNVKLPNASQSTNHHVIRWIFRRWNPVQVNDASFHASKRLVLELLFPKIEELQDLCDSWARKGSEGGAPMSSDRLHSLFSANIIGILLATQLVDLNSGQSRDIESLLAKLSEASISAASNSSDNLSFELLLRTIRPVLPSLNTTGINSLEENAPLLRLVSTLAASVEERSLRQSSGQDQDLMDVDDDFDSQESRVSVTVSEVPRSSISMSLDGEAFSHETIQRLYHCASMHKDNGKVFMEQLLSLPDKAFLLCSTFISELFESDLPISEEDAMEVVGKIGDIMGEPEYSCCEVAHSASLRILQSLMPVCKDDEQPVAKMFGDLYHHFVSKYLPNNLLSPVSQMSLSSLLLALLRTNPQYGSNLGLDSCRTTLLSIMQSGTLPVKFFIGSALPDVFGSYVLKMHDDIFVDVLNSLPTNSQDLEGIAFRLFVLSQLACRWPTLLRRCTYHIFETPGNIMQSSQYAKRCLETVSEALCLSSSQELFRIFSPQLLYTWLAPPDNDENATAINKIEDIPYEIFGFATLEALLREAQTETTALQIMRRSYKDVESLSKRMGTSLVDMVTQGFTKIMAYAIAHELSTPISIGEEGETGETWVRNLLGNEPFLDQIYLNFADIVALLLDLFDQEDPIEKHLSRDKSFEYACEALDEMKQFSQSTTALPPNQQPMFRAKYLTRELFHLCRLTEYELQELWTPALVVSVVRRIFNTVHPALGSFHACSVLRKVRVVIALAGPVALEAYPLEMLLSSVRPFIVDSECADDALGVSRYLITKGAYHLEQTPSFLAGYALSTLASLRVFLESSQSSTTQESQFKATLSKAQTFHSWFSSYLTGYDSTNFADEQQREAFRLITLSASKIRSSGNAEKGTHESTLLMEILRDGERESKLLNEAARDLALGLLCGDFAVPTTGRQDVISDDEEALRHTGLVWKSCNALALSDEYLAWAGRVVGRSFAASGEIQAELLEESELSQYNRIAPGANDSEKGLLSLLQQLTQSKESAIGGLAESALRAVVSEAAAQEDGALVSAAQQTLAESLYLASAWAQYRTPPSDFVLSPIVPDSQVFFRDHVESSDWVQQLAVHLAQSVSEYIVLSALVPILKNVKGFAQDAFPFIVHLALYSQLDKQPHIKRNLSEAAKEWLKIEDDAARTNQKQLINTILYLRTQSIPQETSIADRVSWLDVDFAAAAAAASRCGMYKTALLFTEVAASQTVRSSRRSSAIREDDSTEVLLSIFENIDDPDAYYGLPQSPDFSSVLARLDYEKDGSKNLAFRGAQYDSHIERRDPASQVDSQCLVRALGTLGLAGLSHSLSQTQQSHDGDEASLEDTFHTARRLQLWNLPVPSTSGNCAVAIYKAYQNVQQATDTLSVRNAIYAGFSQTMRSLVSRGLNAANLRQHLGALAVLTELDDIANVADFSELESMLGKFERRGQWMRRGRYEDISHLLSCRKTSLSLISQKPKVRAQALSTAEARQIEIRSMLMSSGIYRFHQATQECLNLSTSLVHLIGPCDELGIKVDAAIKIETANSLWDHGEMIHSIRMLQNIDSDSSLKKQTIPVSRSDLLSKIGYQVSVAKLEKPHDIQKNYLEPALKDLKGNSQGQQAGHVYHQFAMFCDEQLQDQDNLKDLARLQTLRKGKSDEVSQLQDLISNTRDPHLKQRYQGHLNRARLWLGLDEQELRRTEQTRGEFVRLSLENYLLSLTASDEHNNDALRFTALWLERSEEPATNEAVKKHLDKTPTRKFATLMNQLSSRLQDQPSSPFQKLLIQLVYKICLQHPYHGMYQIWSGTKVKTRKEDQVAVLRLKATEKVASLLQSAKSVAATWQAIDRTSSYYHRLAVDRDSNKFKAGQKMALKDVYSAQSLQNALAKYKIPPPTMQLEVSATMDYSDVPIISKLDPQMSIASGVSAPKIITAVGSDGKKYRQLVKGGNDDLRQDAIMEQVFAAVSDLLKLHRSAQQRNLGIRTYKVLPLTSASGLIEFVPNTIPLHDFLMPAHERYFPKDLKGSQCRKDISNAQGKTVEHRITAYRKVIEKFHPVMKYFFMENFVDPDEWFAKRLAYTRTTAAISMLGHVLGLGDRHGHNILLDSKTGEVVHIDLGVAFEMGRILPVPELVPFRLTRDIVDGMGITGTEGVFRRCCEFTLHALREETYSIMTILDVLRYDPLYSWSISPVRLAKLQREVQGEEYNRDDDEGEEDGRKGKKGQQVNEPSEADRALEVVRKKLSKTLSVTATVNDLINQATDISNLAVLYSGWAAYA